MRILVTGGAGYIGSVVAGELANNGYQVAIVDNLRQGHRKAIPAEAEFVQADICDAPELEKIFQGREIDAVMHLAAESAVEYSMLDPGRFFQTNVIGGIKLLDTMLKYCVHNIIFSSSAAVYGEPETIPIGEEHPKVPLNSYGESKLMFERILKWYGQAYDIKHISLRYFNAAGAAGPLGEDHRPESHLIPNVLKAALDNNGRPVTLFGTDYPTKDGSCVRDYVHVSDIARAHILALGKLQSPIPSPQSPVPNPQYNMGNGGGYSVIEVIEAARRVTGVPLKVNTTSRRPGDPAVLVASSKLAKEELGWQPQITRLEDILESAWKWMKEHPEGYGD